MNSRKKKKKVSNAKLSKKSTRGKSARASKKKNKNNKSTSKKRAVKKARTTRSKTKQSNKRSNNARVSKRNVKSAKPKKQAPAKKKARVIKKSKQVTRGKQDKILKRPRRELYDIFLKSGVKKLDEIVAVIDKLKMFKELPNERVKITFVARFKNKISSVTQLYDIDEPQDLIDSLREIAQNIFSKPVRGTTKSIKRMNRLKNYINRIIIDFESAD